MSNAVDLHMHSTYSDGSLTVDELASEASRIGLRAIAVTDHDTVDQIAPAIAAGNRRGIEVIAGVEVSARFAPGTLHILGYGFDPASAPLNRLLDDLRRGRAERNPKIVRRLNELGVDISLEEVAAEAGGAIVGRPHFAAVLVAKGAVPDKQTAFDRYLAKGALAYVPRAAADPQETIAALRAAGAAVVIAHPVQMKLEADELLTALRQLRDWGAAGIEAYSSYHSPAQCAGYRAAAAQLDMIVTGGSDFHGAAKPKIRMGYLGDDGFRLDYDNVVPALLAARA